MIKGVHKNKVDSRSDALPPGESLPRLVKPDPTHQIRKTRVTAQGIKVGMDFHNCTMFDCSW